MTPWWKKQQHCIAGDGMKDNAGCQARLSHACTLAGACSAWQAKQGRLELSSLPNRAPRGFSCYIKDFTFPS